MKFKILLYILFFIINSFYVYSNYNTNYFIPTLNKDSIKGKIVFIRPYSFNDYSESFKIYVNDSFVVKLLGNSYYEYECGNGSYNIKVKNYKKHTYNLLLDSNKTYYINIKIKNGFFTTKPVFILYDSLKANKIISNGYIRKIVKNKPFIRPKSRIGINLISIISGFEKIKLIKLEDGRYSSLSFGGGDNYSLYYGYEVNKSFDLAFEINYKVSKLIPKVSNADVTFKRFAIFLEPSLVIPIDGGDTKRLRLGVSADYYFPSTLSNNIRIANGIHENWRYSETFGYHISFLYELNFTENISIYLAYKYYNVKYQFEKGGLYKPSTTQFRNPDGSSIDLIYGINYHF